MTTFCIGGPLHGLLHTLEAGTEVLEVPICSNCADRTVVYGYYMPVNIGQQAFLVFMGLCDVRQG